MSRREVTFQGIFLCVRLLPVSDDAFSPHSMEFRNLILNIPYLCNTANTHGFMAGQINPATESERIMGKTFSALFVAAGK